MPYQYAATNRDPKSKVSTDGLQLYGVDNTMKMDYWNRHLTMKIHPKKDPSDTSPGVYNYKVKTNVTLAPDTAIILGRLIKDEIIPATKNNEAKHLGLQASKLNVIYVSNGIEETGQIAPYIGLFCNIDETRKPANIAIFKFAPRRVFTKYEPNTGDFAMEERVIEELNLVAEFLLSASDLLGAVTHSIDCDHAYLNERYDAFMSGIGAKLGVQYAQPVNYINRNNTAADPWSGATATPEAPRAEAPTNTSTANVDDLSALLGSRLVTDVKGIKKNLLYGDKVKSGKVKFITY